MYIEKKPCDEMNYHYGIKYFPSAREAFKNVLQACMDKEGCTLFLPAYIGWSPKEGSGIYDPVCDLRARHIFYPFKEGLAIDIDRLKELLKATVGKKLILLVHYFGYVDQGYDQLIHLLRQEDVFIIEDAAHALYTHLIDGACGQGDCIIYSFHKMLPFDGGGAVCTRHIKESWWDRIIPGKEDVPFYRYDLSQIAKKRKQNALYWERALEHDRNVEILRKAADHQGQTPQTFPVLLKCGDRYEVYQRLNSMGYGIISLYHTMIEPVAGLRDTAIDKISNSILNLPVHQDIGTEEIQDMYGAFARIVS